MPATVLSPACVQASSFLTLHYRLAGQTGDLINTFGGKPATLSMGAGELSAALEQCLVGLPEGSRQTFELPADAAYGERSPDRLQWVAHKLLNDLGDPHELYKPGDVVQFPTPDGLGSDAGTVVRQGHEEGRTAILFDFNHPLAGQPVTFEAHVIGVL